MSEIPMGCTDSVSVSQLEQKTKTKNNNFQYEIIWNAMQ